MINRREFMIVTASGIVSAVIGGEGREAMAKPLDTAQKGKKTKVSLVRTSDRATGIKRAIDLLEINPVKGKAVLLKPNFNTADSFPGSTHNDTLANLILHLKSMGARGITIGERSGPPDTSDVMRDKGIYDIAKRLDVGLINFEDLPSEGWVRIRPEKSHWRDGFDVAKPVIDSECVISTCCLKTHAYGGEFTMSLKLSVGITHKRNMRELHSSSCIRTMIAEINQAYKPSLILMDGIEAFVDGGPMHGTRKAANILVAGTDRVAIDAIGLCILKELGSNETIMQNKIFEFEQIARAAELGIGVKRPHDIEIVAEDEDGKRYADRLMRILMEG